MAGKTKAEGEEGNHEKDADSRASRIIPYHHADQ